MHKRVNNAATQGAINTANIRIIGTTAASEVEIALPLRRNE